MTDRVIKVVAALVLDPSGHALLVRKRGTTAFMQPGGKPEIGETASAALCRELAEEVGIILSPQRLSLRGTFRTAAANEPDHDVEATVFEVHLDSEEAASARVSAEIAELAWVTPDATGNLPLAPLTAQFVLALATDRPIPAGEPTPAVRRPDRFAR